MPELHCDVCKTAKFDTYNEVIQHKQNCMVIHINIGYEEGKKLGLDLIVNDKKEFYITHESVIHTLVCYIKSSVARQLLSLNTWDDMDDACLHNLRAFGRKNIPHNESRDLLEVINGECLKALLDCKRVTRCAYYIMKIQYHKNNKVCLGHNLSSEEDLTNVLLRRESYPITLTLQPTGARIKQTARVNSKLDLSNNNLVESIGWNRLLEGLHKLDQLTEIDLSNNNIRWGGCIALASLLEREIVLH